MVCKALTLDTYLPGDYVSETVEIDLYPRRETYGTGQFLNSGTEIMATAIAAFDFPVTHGPDQQDTTTPTTYLGNARANLTAANLRILNYDDDYGSIYNPSGLLIVVMLMKMV